VKKIESGNLLPESSDERTAGVADVSELGYMGNSKTHRPPLYPIGLWPVGNLPEPAKCNLAFYL